MTTITEKITECLVILNKFQTPEGKSNIPTNWSFTLEFSKLATYVRYDMLGYEQEEKGHLSEQFDLKMY